VERAQLGTTPEARCALPTAATTERTQQGAPHRTMMRGPLLCALVVRSREVGYAAGGWAGRDRSMLQRGVAVPLSCDLRRGAHNFVASIGIRLFGHGGCLQDS